MACWRQSPGAAARRLAPASRLSSSGREAQGWGDDQRGEGCGRSHPRARRSARLATHLPRSNVAAGAHHLSRLLLCHRREAQNELRFLDRYQEIGLGQLGQLLCSQQGSSWLSCTLAPVCPLDLLAPAHVDSRRPSQTGSERIAATRRNAHAASSRTRSRLSSTSSWPSLSYRRRTRPTISTS